MLINGVEASVIIPSYREAENLRVLVPRVAAALEKANLSSEIIVVDDNSPDRTDAVCALLEQEFPLRLITRYAERGLASAVIHGLHAAKGDVLIVMDADLSHPPEVIPALVAACRSRFVDFVIGSRYAKGGSVSHSWSTYRRLNSRVASLLARGLTSASDPLSGLFALKRTTFQAASDLCPLGYKIGLELIVRCNCQRVVEVPIHFRDRVAGDSKLSVVQQWQYLHHLVRLYLAKYAQSSPVSRCDRIDGNKATDSSKRVDRRRRPAA